MYRVARGGLEYISVYYAESAADAIKACPHRIKLAADAHEGVPLKSLFAKNAGRTEPRQSSDRRPSRVPDRTEDRGRNDAGFNEPQSGCLLVLGNEERGLSGQVLKACPNRVKIHGSSVIESLNVVQAATILMYELSEHLKN
jgi:tRNA C32,U32 (ribose-2'-O)-methylase TrmJ